MTGNSPMKKLHTALLVLTCGPALVQSSIATMPEGSQRYVRWYRDEHGAAR